MALAPRYLWILIVIHSITIITAVADSDVLCNQTYYLEIGKPAVVSCEYDRSFYAVRWYRNGEDFSFLRIDGKNKGGTGYTSGEFDIQTDGSMVIPEVQLEHENNYTISVLDSTGVVHSRQLYLYVTVLLDGLTLVNCKTSNSKLCNRLALQPRKHALLCIASNSRPPVDITWKTTSVERQSDILTPLDNDFVLNTTSLLYTTFSFVQYHEEHFALEYVTCLVTGTAHGKTGNASMYLEGKEKFQKTTTDVQYVKRGSPFQLECPPNTFELGILKYHHANGTTKILMTFNGYIDTECTFGTNCEAKQHGRFTTDEVSFDDEGSYECIFGDGSVTNNHISNLTVVVLPVETMTIIENCEGNQECTQNTVLYGILKCSVIGLRPSVHLSFEVAENSKDDIFLFNVKNQIVASSNGFSFDTILSAEYDIQECSEPVQVACKADSKIHNDITTSKVWLVTDNRNCMAPEDHRNTGLVVALIIIIIVVIVLAVTVAFFTWRKYGTRIRNSSDVLEPQSVPMKNTNNEVKTETHPEDTKIDGKEKMTREDEKAKKERKALQEKFDNKILPLIEDIKSGKITTDEFIAVLTEFNTEHKVDPLIYLKGFLTGERLETEELLVVIKYIGGSVSNKWPPVNGILEVLKESYQKDLINLTAYANITESFLTKQDEDFDQFFVAMKAVTKDNKYAKSELVNGILQYYVISAISQQTTLKYIGYLGLPNKIAYPHFLQVLLGHIKGGNTETRLQELFNIIVKKAMAEKKSPPDHEVSLQEQSELKFKEKIQDTLNSSHKEDLKNKLPSIFLQVLLYSIEKKTIKVKECMDILTEEVDENRIMKSEYHKAVDLSSQENWLSPGKFIEILQGSLEKNLITDGFFIIHLKVLVAKKELRFKDFIEILERNLEKHLISEHSFEEQFRYYLKLDEWNKENWIRLVCRLWQKRIIEDALKLALLNLTIDKYQMAKSDMKLILDKSGVELEDRKAFMEDVQFPGLIERAKHAI